MSSHMTAASVYRAREQRAMQICLSSPFLIVRIPLVASSFFYKTCKLIKRRICMACMGTTSTGPQKWVGLVDFVCFSSSIVHYHGWLRDQNINSRVCNFSRINPLALDLMELFVKQNVMISSVLLKSSTQLYSIRLHCFKLPPKESTDCPSGALSRSASS